MVSGCGSSANTPAPDAPADAPPSPVKVPKTAEKVTLTWPCIWIRMDSKAGLVKEINDEFNANNSEKIEIVIEESSDYQAYRDKLRTLILTGKAPDIFTVDSDIEMILSSDKLVDFSSYMDSAWDSTFQPDALKNGEIGGKLKGMQYVGMLVVLGGALGILVEQRRKS